MHILARIARHARITLRNFQNSPSPPFLILFINSTCNQKCDHCFYWRNLNRDDDLTMEEMISLSRSLGRIENLNLSGGEPFLRKEFAEICLQFIRHNQVRQIYVPTNAYFTERIVARVEEILKEKELDLFAVEFSLEGTEEFHDRFRVSPGSFRRAMESYEALAEIQRRDPRLRIHATSCATDRNMDELRRLTTYLFEHCPLIDHHNLVLIRGDRKDPTLQAPMLDEYEDLYRYFRRLWKPREEGRYGSMVEPIYQWAKVQTAQAERQVIPCRAGVLSAVVYSNGDVSVCENHPPLGNLRANTFPEIWSAAAAGELRNSIARKDCHCTNETFLWPSVVYQPFQLLKSMIGARIWRRPESLGPQERPLVQIDSSNSPSRGAAGASSGSNGNPPQPGISPSLDHSNGEPPTNGVEVR